MAVGWIPVRGAAAGLVADTFLEFSYLGIFACFATGLFYGYLWWRMTASRGVWTILFVIAAALCIYVPTQNITAWLYRFLLMGVPTVVLWKFYIAPSQRILATPALQADRNLRPARAV
jgi:hypothetical protein